MFYQDGSGRVVTIYKLAKKQNPHRWSGKTRNWTQTKTVVLNGNYKKAKDKAA
jgi:hypothetical protein